MVLAMTIMSYLTYSSQRFYRQAKDAHGDLQNTIVESYHGKKTIKNFQAEKSFVDLFREYCQKELKLFFRGSIAPSVSVPLIPLSVAISFVWGCYIIVQQNLGASAIILLSGFIFLFLEPMMFVGWIGIVITQSIGSWDRINELVKSIETEDGQEVKLRLNNDFQKKLNLHDHLKLNLPFWNLTSPVELTIWEFRWLVLVGRTGCGKTTLLQGIAEVLKRNHLKISFVGQESFIYNDSFQSNIFLGLTPNRQQLETAYYFLELFGLSNLTHSAASLWKMELGENGKQLSGGQCKRLALVRSLMSEAPYLLWDDPFSSVDYILEKEILVKLKAHPLIQKKTFVLTSHRLSTVKYCDYVVLLEKDVGILESGVTKELLSQGSKTNEYFQKQLV
jgi:ATP-binding cassette subfamily B protein